MMTMNLNMNLNTLTVVNITLCNIRPCEGFDLFGKLSNNI